MDKKPAFGIKDVCIQSREVRHQGFLAVDELTLRHRLYAGGWSPEFSREVVRRKPGVGVLLYDPDLDKVLMVEQFRAGCLDNPAGPWMLELVAGMVDSDESTTEIAVREAREEAGVEIGALIPICEYYNSPGGSNEHISLYCAGFDASRAGGLFGLVDEHEDILCHVLDRRQVCAAVNAGRINNAMSIIALQWLSLNLEHVKHTLKEFCNKSGGKDDQAVQY